MAGYAANSLQTAILTSIFNSKAVNGSSGVTVTGTATALWVALHQADPVASGNQATFECTYSGYLRVLTDRTTGTGGWTVTGNSPASASPLTSITFPICTAVSTTIATNFSVGSSSSGAGILYYSGPVTSNITITNNVTASLTTASAITQD